MDCGKNRLSNMRYSKSQLVGVFFSYTESCQEGLAFGVLEVVNVEAFVMISNANCIIDNNQMRVDGLRLLKLSFICI